MEAMAKNAKADAIAARLSQRHPDADPAHLSQLVSWALDRVEKGRGFFEKSLEAAERTGDQYRIFGAQLALECFESATAKEETPHEAISKAQIVDSNEIEILPPTPPPEPEDPRIAKLREAYEGGKISKQVYERNLMRFTRQNSPEPRFTAFSQAEAVREDAAEPDDPRIAKLREAYEGGKISKEFYLRTLERLKSQAQAQPDDFAGEDGAQSEEAERGTTLPATASESEQEGDKQISEAERAWRKKADEFRQASIDDIKIARLLGEEEPGGPKAYFAEYGEYEIYFNPRFGRDSVKIRKTGKSGTVAELMLTICPNANSSTCVQNEHLFVKNMYWRKDLWGKLHDLTIMPAETSPSSPGRAQLHAGDIVCVFDEGRIFRRVPAGRQPAENGAGTATEPIGTDSPEHALLDAKFKVLDSECVSIRNELLKVYNAAASQIKENAHELGIELSQNFFMRLALE